jgi:adhesin transport system outer membrane protein
MYSEQVSFAHMWHPETAYFEIIFPFGAYPVISYAMRKIFALGLLFFGLNSGPAQAQQVCDFDCVLTSALANHPVIMGRRSAQVAARAEKEGAEWARYPSPSIEASSQAGNDNTVGLLRLDQPLWTGGRITAGIEAAGSRLDAAGGALDEARRDMSLRVINSYAEALRQKDRVRFAEEGVREHEKLLEMIRRRVKQNVSSQTDQRLAESRLFQVKNESLIAGQSLKNILANLEQLSGKAVLDVFWPDTDERGIPATLETAQRLALAASPTLRRLRHEEMAATADIDSSRSAYLPSVALRFEHSTGTSVSDDSRAFLVLLAQPGAGFSAGSGVEAAIAQRETVRLTSVAAEREIRERIALDWNEWVAGRLRFEAAQNASEISSEVFDSYARQYVIGRKSWIDVLNAVRETLTSFFTLADARSQTFAAGLRLQTQTAPSEMKNQDQR